MVMGFAELFSVPGRQAGEGAEVFKLLKELDFGGQRVSRELKGVLGALGSRSTINSSQGAAWNGWENSAGI